MKKYFLIAFLTLSFIGVGLFTAVKITRANPPAYDRVFMTPGGGSATATTVATTTGSTTSLTGSGLQAASTTFPFLTNQSDSVTLDFNYTASTSAGKLVAQVFVSNDNLGCDVTPLNCNWFGVAAVNSPVVSASGATTTIVIASTTALYTFQPSLTTANATSSISWTLPTVTAKYMKVTFGSMGSDGALWTEANLKRQQPQ